MDAIDYKILKKMCIRDSREAAFIACKDTPIVLASLGNDAGIYGAAKMLID